MGKGKSRRMEGLEMSAKKEVEDVLAGLSDRELLNALAVDQVDLEVAAEKEPNSDWHQACFAAVYVYAEEAGNRGIVNSAFN